MTQPLCEQLVHAAMTHLLPSTLAIHDDNVLSECTITWAETCNVLAEWEDREGCSSDYLTERHEFTKLDYPTLARYTATAMNLIRDMTPERASQIVGSR